jgi:predicted ATP-grasp superfamily ATP-dependent carboligase
VIAEGRAVLLGVTRQLVGPIDGSDAEGFCYLGSVGPIRLEATALDQVTRLGEFLAQRFDLVGLVGVDFVLDGQRVWPIEVNPRYTASMEVLERSGDFSAVGMHRDACLAGRLPSISPTTHGVYEKRILYASCTFTVDDQLTSTLLELASRSVEPMVADIPRSGTHVAPGHPIVTLLTPSDGAEARDVRSLLERYTLSLT